MHIILSVGECVDEIILLTIVHCAWIYVMQNYDPKSEVLSGLFTKEKGSGQSMIYYTWQANISNNMVNGKPVLKHLREESSFTWNCLCLLSLRNSKESTGTLHFSIEKIMTPWICQVSEHTGTQKVNSAKACYDILLNQDSTKSNFDSKVGRHSYAPFTAIKPHKYMQKWKD